MGLDVAAAKLFGISFALGDFFAGMVLNQPELSHKAGTHSLPLHDAFGVLFFVFVGMLFDPSILVREPLMVLAVLGLVLFGKSLAALAIVLLLRFPWRTGVTVAVALAQIGEFSFILGGLGLHYGVLDAAAFNLILAAALISIMPNPLFFGGGDRLLAWVEARSNLQGALESSRRAAVELVQRELDMARERAVQRAAESKTFTPEELASAFRLFAGLTPEQREVLVLHFQPVTVPRSLMTWLPHVDSKNPLYRAAARASTSIRSHNVIG